MKEESGMDFIEHFSELRKRIFYIAAVLVIAMAGGLLAAGPIITRLKNTEPASAITWNVFSPWDAIRIYVNVSLVFAVVLTLPFTLYQLWAFVKPALHTHEKKASLVYIPFAFILALAGLAFGYFVVFPAAFYFTSSITQTLELTETYGIAQYFSFMFNILIPLSVLFELPIIVMFLTKIRILNPARLQKMRRYAYLALVVVGAMVTPPDAISALIVAVPMVLLYEFSVLLSGVVYRKQAANEMN